MNCGTYWLRIVGLTALLGSSVQAVEAGRASGTFDFDVSTAKLAFAACYEGEDRFDSTKSNTLVVLTDIALGEVAPSDEWQLAQSGKQGDIVALTLRLDGAKLVNVRVNHKGLKGSNILPGQWFTYRPAKAAAGLTAGTLSLPKHDVDGCAYSCNVEFVAAPAAATPKAAPEAAAPAPAEQPAPLPPATTSSIDPKTLTTLCIAAMMQKDEAQALKLIKLGADPNGRDQYGIPVLNWAVMMGMPKVVQALVDAKADLTYERAPGMTILKEAGACPEAEKILRAAGAK